MKKLLFLLALLPLLVTAQDTQLEVDCGAAVQVVATPSEGFRFVRWTDGETDNPRTVTAMDNLIFSAIFEKIEEEQDTTFIHNGEEPNIGEIPGDDPNIVVEPGGELNVNIADIRLGVITVVTTGSASGQIHGADHLGNSWRIFMEYKLNPFGSTASPNLWYAFAVPFEVDIETGITRAYGKKSHVSGVDFQILEYDSWQRATTGKGWVKKMSGTLEPGHFYMIGIEGNCNRWLFEKKSDASIAGGNNKPISSYFAGNSDNGKHNGWNGMGNSTLEYADFSFSDALIEYLHLYNNQSGVWETRLLDEIAHLVVGQPFFVQATADGSVTFAPTPSNIAARRNMRAKEERKMLRLTFEADKSDSHVDRLYLTLHDDDLCGSYTLGRDLMRMESSCKTVPQFWCLAEDGTQLNAHGISIPETETIVPLELFAPANGRYLLTVRPEQMEDFVAELLYQGTYIATLFDAQPLTLDLPSGTTSDYSLRIRRKAPQGLNDVQSDKEQCTKVLHEGHMYILQGGHIYDAQGKKVK